MVVAGAVDVGDAVDPYGGDGAVDVAAAVAEGAALAVGLGEYGDVVVVAMGDGLCELKGAIGIDLEVVAAVVLQDETTD